MGYPDYDTSESVTPAFKAEDRGTGTDAVDKTRGIHCNVGDTYELTFNDGGVIDMVLVTGLMYPYCVTNVLTTGSAAIDAGDITLLY